MCSKKKSVKLEYTIDTYVAVVVLADLVGAFNGDEGSFVDAFSPGPALMLVEARAAVDEAAVQFPARRALWKQRTRRSRCVYGWSAV